MKEKISLVNKPSTPALGETQSGELSAYREKVEGLRGSLEKLRTGSSQRESLNLDLREVLRERERLFSGEEEGWSERVAKLNSQREVLTEKLEYESRTIAQREEDLQREALTVCESLRVLWRSLGDWILAG